MQLKGFSPVFEPFYWEDTDLSYRGQQQGWKVLFDPRCKVIHHHILFDKIIKFTKKN
jgi:GT2 family glycosyltransferase